MGYSDVDRAGDTDAAKRREKAPAVPFLTDSGADPASLDPDALSRWLVSQGFFDADTDQAKYVIGRLGYDHLLPYLVAVKESRPLRFGIPGFEILVPPVLPQPAAV